MKASPGPWKALIGEDNQHEFERPEGVWGTVIDRNDFHVCRIWDDVAELHEPEANARLISAAPDLLEVCIKIFDRICDCESTDDGWLYPAIYVDDFTALTQAIRKAEGGAE